MSSRDQGGVELPRKPYSKPRLLKQAKLAQLTAVLAAASGAPPPPR
jgi:hypothetical protein